MKIDKSRRIMFFVSLIGIVVVTLIMGTTFAYQTLVVDYKEGSDNDTIVEAGKLNVSYENNNKIDLKNMTLLPDYKTADYTEFTLKTNDTSYDVAYQINLKNLVYTDSMVSESFKYTITLVEKDEEFVIGEGDFSTLTGTEFNIPFNMNTYRILGKGKNETLRLYLWLKENENTQNLEKSSFKGYIEIVSLFSNEITDTIYKTLKIYGNSIENQLPSEYQQVEYIESSGTQYIDMNYGYNINDEINISFMKTQDTGNIQGIFGNGNLSTYTGTVLYINNSNILTVTIGGILGQEFYKYETETIQNKKIYNVKFSEKKVFLDDNLIITVNNDLKNGTQTDFSLFRRWNTNGMYGRIYNFNIKRNGSLIHEMIPCYRKSDNVVGMYDIVENEFYTNSGTGEFSKGNDIIEIQNLGQYDETTGKYKIPVTVKGKNLFNKVTVTLGKNLNASTGGLYNSSARGVSDYIEIDPSKQYTFVYNSDFEASRYITCYDKDKNFILGSECQKKVSGEFNNFGTMSFISDEVKYIRANFFWNTEGTESELDEFIIYEGSGNNAFEPYIEPVITNVYLNEPLRKVDDNTDYIDLVNGKIVRNVKVNDNTGTLTLENSYTPLEVPSYKKLDSYNIPYIEYGKISVCSSNNICASNIEIELNK